MAVRKRIVVLAPSSAYPPTDGGSQVTADICNRLAKYATVKLLTNTQLNHPQNNNLNIVNFFSATRSKYVNLNTIFCLYKLFKTFRPHCCILIQPFYFFPAYVISKLFRTKFVIYSLNLEFNRFSSLGRLWAGMLYPYEFLAYRSTQLTVFISEKEQLSAINLFRLPEERTAYLPHGIVFPSGSHNSAWANNPHQYRIIFFGNLNYLPNRLAVELLVQEIAPRLGQYISTPYRIDIAGSGFEVDKYQHQTLNKLNISFLGFVDDLREFIIGADLMLNPVQSGGGIQTKIIDTVACGVTVVASRTGSLGLPVSVFGKKLCIVNDNDWVGYCESTRDILRHTSRIPTPKQFFDHYNDEKVLEQLLEM